MPLPMVPIPLALVLVPRFLVVDIPILGVIQEAPSTVYRLDSPALVIRRSAVLVGGEKTR